MKKSANLQIYTFLVISVIVLLNFRASSQIILVDSTFTQDSEFYPFFSLDAITGLSIDADIELNNDTSLVRVVLVTDDNKNFLIYEAYPLIVETNSFVIHDGCDETCFLDNIEPVACKVLLIDATIKINSIKYSLSYTENLLSEQLKRKNENDVAKSLTMNNRIVDYNMYWESDVTSIVQMMYNEKKDVFGDKYNFCGWDYYRNGVFELLGHQNSLPETTSLTKSFDWRSRHGANCSDPGYYYDGDEHGSGWLTDVRDQYSCGTCWAFSANGTVEAMFNLYNNNHFDFSLSIKEYLCCNPPVGDCGGGIASNALNYITLPGVPSEYCYKYMQPPFPNCTGKCNPVDSIFKINSSGGVLVSDNDDIKNALITKGPLSVSIPAWEHAVVLNGYIFKNEKTIWIIKNSWGADWGNYGFGYIADYQGLFNQSSIYYITQPKLYVEGVPQNLVAEPRDEDFDGYCNWGLGPAPVAYPECLSHPKDCDDSNPYIGPYDEEYNCTCLVEFDPEIEEIDYVGHWDTPRAIDQIIEISSGWSLEITSTVYFGPGTKIIIKPGARLVINGGKLTKACNELWDGIEVHGQPLFRQTPEYQGLIDIKNGGTIEFAKTAIITGKKDNGIIINGFEGGIIIAENATFRDNEIDIEMLPYRDNVIVPPFTWPNQSRFKECAFITDAVLYEYSYPSAHIRLDGIYGLQITSCEFKNDVGFEKWTVNYLGTGIYSFNSTFLLKRACSLPIPLVLKNI